MKKYALAVLLGTAMLPVQAQISGKTANLNLADYDLGRPSDTLKVRLSGGDAESTAADPVALAPLFPLGVYDDRPESWPLEAANEAEPVAAEAGSTPTNGDAVGWGPPAVGGSEAWPTLQGSAGQPVPDESVLRAYLHRVEPAGEEAEAFPGDDNASVDVSPRPNERLSPGETWQYTARRRPDFLLQVRREYLDWLLQFTGLRADGYRETSPFPAEIRLLPAPDTPLLLADLMDQEAQNATLFSVKSTWTEELTRQQAALEQTTWHVRDTGGPEPMGVALGNTAAVAQDWQTYGGDFDIVRLPGVDIEQRGSDHLARVIQQEGDHQVFLAQEGTGSDAQITQTQGDNSVEISQLGVSHSVTTEQTGQRNGADVWQTGTGQVVRIQQGTDQDDEGGQHHFELAQSGKGNTFEGKQVGTGNRVDGVEATDSARQAGHQNLTVFEQTGRDNAFSHEQRGTGQRAVATQVGVRNQVIIVQQQTP